MTDTPKSGASVIRTLLDSEKGRATVLRALTNLQKRRILNEAEQEILSYCEHWEGIKQVLDKAERHTAAIEKRKSFRVIKWEK